MQEFFPILLIGAIAATPIPKRLSLVLSKKSERAVLPTDKTVSKNEKRYLTQCPKLSIESVLSGNFSEKFELYFSDQFPLRDFWIYLEKGLKKVVDTCRLV